MPTTRINAKNRIAQVREKRRIDETPAESADTIKDYVDHLADIAIFADETGGTLDFDTPLVDNTLPADIDPEAAARLPSDLRAAPAGCENTERDAATEMLTATRIPPKGASGSLPETGTVNAD